jgi:glycosyltransferase involved in cell wall biosynthesis
VKLEGISFIIRARDEEATLADSLQSLRGLEIPHETVVILHRCTDRSAEIARKAHATQIVEYPYPTSRAGYETLITPAHWPQSISSYCNWCYQKARRQWTFKWDADFIASVGLIKWLNSRQWKDTQPTKIYITAQDHAGIDNTEPYLTNIPANFAKYIFWEYNAPLFLSDVQEIRCPEIITHASNLQVIKPYWKQAPWYQNLNTPQAQELRSKRQLLEEIIGPEPQGSARAGDSQCPDIWYPVVEKQELLRQQGIMLWE